MPTIFAKFILPRPSTSPCLLHYHAESFSSAWDNVLKALRVPDNSNWETKQLNSREALLIWERRRSCTCKVVNCTHERKATLCSAASQQRTWVIFRIPAAQASCPASCRSIGGTALHLHCSSQQCKPAPQLADPARPQEPARRRRMQPLRCRPTAERARASQTPEPP